MTRLEDEIQRIVDSIENEEQNEQVQGKTQQEPQTNSQTPPDEIKDFYVLVFREREEEDQAPVVDSELVKPQPPPFDYVTLGIVLICCLPTLASIMLQMYMLLNPPIATVTIIPKSQTVTLTITLQLGRLLNPITISQSQTAPTTGKGHQDARPATGYLTFYNGQFQSVTVAAGTILTSSSGIQIITDQDATIPAANPPIFGQTTVSAHAESVGSKGNIPAYDINEACCATSVLAKNINPFAGGQDERDFSTVSTQDIHKLSAPLKTALAQSMQGALQGHVNPNEQLQILPCTPTVASDHQIGQEATQVNVTVSETCRAVAYPSQEVAEQAAVLLSTQAQQHIGTGYGLFGTVHVSVQAATITGSSTVWLTFSASGTWVYGLSQQTQEQIKHLLAGKTTQTALQLLAALPGAEQAAIRFSGFGDATRLPKQSSLIHLAFIVI